MNCNLNKNNEINASLRERGYELCEGEIYKRYDLVHKFKCIECKFEFMNTVQNIKKLKRSCKNCEKIKIINLFEEKGCKLLDDPSKSIPMKYICSCGNESRIKLFNFKKGERCKKCGIKKQKENNKHKDKIQKEIHDYFKSQNCKLLTETYINQKSPLNYICSCGNKTISNWKAFKKGTRCNFCAKEKIKNRRILKGKDHPFWNPNREELELAKKIREKVSSAFKRTLREIKKNKDYKMFDYLNFSKQELINKIINDPNWNVLKNTSWELDHVFPVKAFLDYKIYDEKIINDLENLRPLSRKENRIKNSKYDKEEFEKWLIRKNITYYIPSV